MIYPPVQNLVNPAVQLEQQKSNFFVIRLPSLRQASGKFRDFKLLNLLVVLTKKGRSG